MMISSLLCVMMVDDNDCGMLGYLMKFSAMVLESMRFRICLELLIIRVNW